MQKLLLSVAAFVTIILFASADYLVNFRTDLFIQTDLTAIPLSDEISRGEVRVVEAYFNLNQERYPYRLSSRYQTFQLFEQFDLRTLAGVDIYRNAFVKNGIPSLNGEDLVVYEIQGEEGQGHLNYLSARLLVISQLDSEDQLNDVDYGENAFFYNHPDQTSTAFLFVQIGDDLFGFQYDKGDDHTFNLIERLVNDLNLQLSVLGN